jgi:hypothetical protein
MGPGRRAVVAGPFCAWNGKGINFQPSQFASLVGWLRSAGKSVASGKVLAMPWVSPRMAELCQTNPVIPDLPIYIAEAIKANPTTWRFFRGLPLTERRNFVVWIHIAKRSETRERRERSTWPSWFFTSWRRRPARRSFAVYG